MYAIFAEHLLQQFRRAIRDQVLLNKSWSAVDEHRELHDALHPVQV